MEPQFEKAMKFTRPYGTSYKLMSGGKCVGIAHEDRETNPKTGEKGSLKGYYASADTSGWDGYIHLGEAKDFGLPILS
jgi:hypothetical protein